MRLLRFLLLGISFHLATAVSASADWPAEGIPLCATCSARFLLIAPDGAGGAFVAWLHDDLSSSGYDDVYLQRITGLRAISAGWPVNGLPVAALPRSQGHNTLVPDGSGGVVSAWYDFRNAYPDGSTGPDIYAQRILAGGTPAPGWMVNGMPVTRRLGYQARPVALADGAGGAFFSWSETAFDPDIYLQRLTETGQPAAGWPTDGLPVCVLPGIQDVPHLAGDGQGGAYIAWGDLRDGALATYTQRITAAGEVFPGWPACGVLITRHAVRELIADGEGGGYLSAAIFGQSDSFYYLHRFTATGEIAPGWPEGGAPVCTLTTALDGGPTALKMVLDDQGGVLLAWSDNRWLDYSDHYDDEIYVQRVRSDGSLYPGWPPNGVRLTDNNAYDSFPELVSDGRGGAYLCWERVANPLGEGRIVVQHVTGAGAIAPGWPAEGHVIPGEKHMGRPVITTDGQGGAIVAWEHMLSDVRALRFPADFVTAVQVSLSSSEASADRVSLTWRVTGPQVLAYTVERRDENGPWQALGLASRSGNENLHFEDRDVTAGARYTYRLRYESEGSLAYSAPVGVDVPLGVELALRGFEPNPCRGEPIVAFSLPSAAPATLELYDLQGRRVMAREVGTRGAGKHRLRVEGGGLTPGIYLARLSQAGRSAVARGIVIP